MCKIGLISQEAATVIKQDWAIKMFMWQNIPGEGKVCVSFECFLLRFGEVFHWYDKKKWLNPSEATVSLFEQTLWFTLGFLRNRVSSGRAGCCASLSDRPAELVLNWLLDRDASGTPGTCVFNVCLTGDVKKRAFDFPEKETIATSPEIFMSKVFFFLLHKKFYHMINLKH